MVVLVSELIERIKEIEAEMARTQKNKATEFHLGVLKARIAKLRTQLMEGPKTGAAKGEGFDVMKSGDGRVALIGFPSVGEFTPCSMTVVSLFLAGCACFAASFLFTGIVCMK